MKKLSRLLLCLSGIFLCASIAFAEPPPEDAVANSIVNMIAAQYNLQNAPREIFILDDFEITNYYTKVVDGETGHLYEFRMNLKVKGWDGGSNIIEGKINDYGLIEGTVALVKRGSKWYSIE